MFDILIFDSNIFDVGKLCILDVIEEKDTAKFICTAIENAPGITPVEIPQNNVEFNILESQDKSIFSVIVTETVRADFNFKEKTDKCKIVLKENVQANLKAIDEKDYLSVHCVEERKSHDAVFSIKEYVDYVSITSKLAVGGVSEEELLFTLLLLI